MAVDTVLNWPCGVKQSLAQGDSTPAVVQLVELLKTRHRVASLARIAAEKGLAEEQMAITLQVDGPPGRESTRSVRLPELRAQAAKLEPLEPHCVGCPANVTALPFGCVHFTQYPISQAAEQWLMDRLLPPTLPGGFLLLAAFQDLGYDGAPIQEYREHGLFEAAQPIVKTLLPNRFHRSEINSNQLFHAIFGVGIELDVSHVLMVLMWLGAITLDGAVPTTPQHFATLNELTPAQRKERTRLELGDPAGLAHAGDLPGFLALLFRCWQLDQPALVDS